MLKKEVPLQGVPEQLPNEYDNKSVDTISESGSYENGLIRGPYGPGLLAGARNASKGLIAFRIKVLLNIGARLICAIVTVTGKVADNFVS